MEVKGIITWVGPLTSGETENGSWARQDIVVEYGSVAYSKKAALRLGKGLLQKFIGKKPDGTKDYEHIEPHIGMKGTFTFDVDAREYQGKWFTTLKCYQYEPMNQGQNAEQSGTETQKTDDDLCF